MSEIVRIVNFCQPTSCCKHNAKLQQSLVCIPWRTLWFSRWWRPGTRRRQSWTTERWNTSVEEDTVTWSYKRNRQLTVYNSCATTTRVYLSVNYSFMSHKPATGRVQFEILLPFIIRVIERINFVTRLPWYAVVITLLFGKEKELTKEKRFVKRAWKSFTDVGTFHTWYSSLICSKALWNFSRDHTVVRPFFVLFKRIFISDCRYSKTLKRYASI